MVLTLWAAASLCGPAGAQSKGVPRSLSLAGEWRFLLDADDRGLRDRVWQTMLPDKIQLPGSTETGRFSLPGKAGDDGGNSSRLFAYSGVAWYQRDITIPNEWRRRRVTLFLERCQGESRAWLDDRPLGAQESPSCPHVYELSTLARAGRHRLTVRVDNRSVGGADSTADPGWNGIIGRLELHGTARVWIDDVRVYPDLQRRAVRVRARIGNVVGTPVQVVLTFRSRQDGALLPAQPVLARGVAPKGYTWLETRVALGSADRLWSEHSPTLYGLSAELSATDGATTWIHSSEVTFGMRDLAARGADLVLNGRRILLRGASEDALYPLTGFPPMDRPFWTRLMRLVRSFGLNHLRFRSWCPPRAAFEAADAAGVLLQVETPVRRSDAGLDPERDAFLMREVRLIIDTFGNHPSFGLWCGGSHMAGEADFLERMIRDARAHDPRHVYAASSAGRPVAADDYVIASADSVLNYGRAGGAPASPLADHDADAIAAGERPMIVAEVGQVEAFPDITAIGKYTGVVHARRLVEVNRSLTERGMVPYALPFARASLQAAVEVWRQEIEGLSRAPRLAGFQLSRLADSADSSGQSAGLLDPFRDSKRGVSADAVRRFCAATTVVAHFSKRTFSAGERLAADVEIAHFGEGSIAPARADWTVTGADGTTVGAGAWTVESVREGERTPIGRLDIALSSVSAPQRLTIRVAVREMGAANEWDAWVYPATDSGPFAEGVYVTDRLDGAALEKLRQGGRVALLAGPAAIRWSERGGALGVFCDPSHPALSGFPTESWGGDQWIDMLRRSRAMVLAQAPGGLAVPIRSIDSPSRNLPLAYLIEGRVGDGRLVACSLDVLSDPGPRHEARQALKSVLDYAASEAFQPTARMDEAALGLLFRIAGQDPTRPASGPDLQRSVLHVRSSLAAAPNTEGDWTPEADVVSVRREGYDYRVSGRFLREAHGSAWWDPKELRISITVPPVFVGDLYVRFHDWDNRGRIAQLDFEERLHDTVASYHGRGVWVRLPVTLEDASDGRLELRVRPETANDLITDIALIPVSPPDVAPDSP